MPIEVINLVVKKHSKAHAYWIQSICLSGFKKESALNRDMNIFKSRSGSLMIEFIGTPARFSFVSTGDGAMVLDNKCIKSQMKYEFLMSCAYKALEIAITENEVSA